MFEQIMNFLYFTVTLSSLVLIVLFVGKFIITPISTQNAAKFKLETEKARIEAEKYKYDRRASVYEMKEFH